MQNEIRGDVSRTNNAVVTPAGDFYKATTVTPRYGQGKLTTKVIGYTYTIEIDGTKYQGKATGPQASIVCKKM